jgi:hypothetical protein
VSETPQTRSVKIGADERTGWSSERPRRDGETGGRPVDVAVRCRILTFEHRMRYSPGSLLIVSGTAAVDPSGWAARVVEESSAVLSLAKIRALLAGRVAEEAIEDQAHKLLYTAVTKRLREGQSVVVPLEGFDEDSVEGRREFARVAHSLRRPRHLILLDSGKDEVAEDEERKGLDEMRRLLDTGALGEESFQTAMRLGGATRSELKKIVFRPPPKDD